MSNKLRLLVSEALRSISSNVSTTVAATMTVLIGMFLLGLCIALGSWMVSWSNHQKRQLLVHVYFCVPETCSHQNQPTKGRMEAVRLEIEQLKSEGLVKDYEFVPKQQAYAAEKKAHPELYKGLLSNPLPDAFEITPAHAENVTTIADRLDHPLKPGVQKVNYGEKMARRVLRVAQVIEISFIIMVLILLAASTALIANTIRLSLYSRRREIEVMKLVGASDWFVRGPFLIEGMICSFGGALIAVILLYLAKAIALPAIVPHLEAGSDVHAWPFAVTALLMLLAGLTLGAAGTAFTLRRFLRV
jgi:cell division transport system permease protein